MFNVQEMQFDVRAMTPLLYLRQTTEEAIYDEIAVAMRCRCWPGKIAIFESKLLRPSARTLTIPRGAGGFETPTM
jgi:hypothetical protein